MGNKQIKKILIANRGEIAVRIQRTCREMGIASVAVYSECDRLATHVQWAEEAHYLGPSPATESYLCQEKILEVADKCGADAIHPGYGFLSENAAFAERCQQAGLIFIGPSPETMRALGDKIQSRRSAEKLGIPMTPGSRQALQDLQGAQSLAEELGYPVLVKVSAGGGGKGLHLAASPEELEHALLIARTEAEQSFNDSTVYLEKYLENPHHIEVQVFGDSLGRVLTLGERECSLQRRHQKIIEESPSPFLNAKTREDLEEAARTLAESVGYQNAGTVEFLVDGAGKYYFLEMNTRLQVEHPVTEFRTGLDLVRLQIEIANGRALRDLLPHGPTFQGHAIECRIYAEDPDRNFLPSPGKILRIRDPEGPGVRVDSSAFRGGEIPIYYDPMIAKLITFGARRSESIQRMARALREYQILGLKTNLSLLSALVAHSAFQEGIYDTQFVEKNINQLRGETHRDGTEIAALAAFLFQEWNQRKPEMNSGPASGSAWERTARLEALG